MRRNNPLKPLQINKETTDVDDESNVTNEFQELFPMEHSDKIFEENFVCARINLT